MSEPYLIAYDSSDGIENALYPSRYTVLSRDPATFIAAVDSAEAMLSFLFDDITRPIAFAVVHGDTVIEYGISAVASSHS